MNDDLAIMDLKDIRDYLIECNYNIEAIEYAIKAIEERPIGEWIILDSGDRACPFCNMGMSRESNPSLVFFNYCPFCGADMRGGRENE